MKEPKVAIVMGSSSDEPVMKEATIILRKFGIPYEEKIISAHRNPKALFRYTEELEKRGIEVVIAGAGKAAHLPGIIAAITPLPVIGVPMETKDLGGMDSLFSIVQMPNGVPVATVGIGLARNSAILAAQILSLKYPEIRKKLKEYKEELAQGGG